jgi:hypothetical protein
VVAVDGLGMSGEYYFRPATEQYMTENTATYLAVQARLPADHS